MFDAWRGFTKEKLSSEWYDKLTEMARICRGNILKMTTLAMSGHPGGSMSSIEVYLMLYMMANVDPKNPGRDDRDRVIVSHGHTSPGAYTALATAGFFNVDDAIAGFRLAGSPFEGHVERSVPGIEWGTGNLGQGLSVGVGKALYARLSEQKFHSYVFMGDGEQQKGQISESRRIASKFKLSNLTAIIDYNNLQISGDIREVMPQNIVDNWQADGWKVLEVDGHDFYQLYDAFRQARQNLNSPIMILARTTMGKNVSFMENDHNYHGAPVKPDRLTEALVELGCENDLEKFREKRNSGEALKAASSYQMTKAAYPKVNPGTPIVYPPDTKIDNRSAFGNALISVADANRDNKDFKIAVFDCDLAGSVKTAGFAKKYPDSFFQFGITEHATATTVGALSAENAIGVWADFGMFAIAETYNQARLNDINHGNVKLFCTHCGLNVGEDGMTHQSIDYFGLLNSTFGWKVITPSDPNQTDKIVRYVLSTPGNFAVIMGRSPVPIVTKEDGTPCYGKDYNYRYGRMQMVRMREPGGIALVCAGNMLSIGMEVYEKMNGEIALYSISDWSDILYDNINQLSKHDEVVVLEDHNVKTGLGTAITEVMIDRKNMLRLEKFGVKMYGSSGKPTDLYKQQGLDSDSIVESLTNKFRNFG